MPLRKEPAEQVSEARLYPWLLALIGLGTLFFVGPGRIFQRWWFGDDPIQFAAVRSVANPARFFFDLKYARQFGSGQGVVPMQMLDYWIDTHLPTPMPLSGYVHGLLTTLAALLAIFFVLRRVTGEARLAFAGAVVWMLLPSTFATCLFLSTRHYVEGLVFSCVVFCIVASPRRITPLMAALLVVASIAAVLSKEIYASLVPTLLLAFGIVRRNRPLTASAFILGLAYAVYRTLSVGGSMKYVVSLLGPKSYLKYLAVFPYTFTESFLAYPLLIVALWATIRFYREGGDEGRRYFWVFAALLGTTMFILYPVAAPTEINFNIPGPWLRTTFLPATIVLVWICFLVRRLVPAPRQFAAIAVVGVLVLPGLVRGVNWWNDSMARQEAEGRFFIDPRGRLLYSTDADVWFFDGLRDWYRMADLPVLLQGRPDPSHERAELKRAGQVWSFKDGEVRPDAEMTESYLRQLGPDASSRPTAAP